MSESKMPPTMVERVAKAVMAESHRRKMAAFLKTQSSVMACPTHFEWGEHTVLFRFPKKGESEYGGPALQIWPPLRPAPKL